MATIYIDDVPYEVEDGQDLLSACLSLGFDVPYFCWHPAMHSVGACRQCAVKQFRDENDKRGKIVMSCMTDALDGTRISIDDPEVKQFRAAVLEFLMINHPHDCPVCDEGGECHLQDMTLMTGHAYRNYRFKKRTWINQYLGPFINQEMNRCIECYRCVRFYGDYAGGRDFGVFGIGMHVFFGRFQEGALENEFSGNLVEICPTGVFTDKTLKKHYTRTWDLQTAPSICVHCGVGCNTIPGERYGTLRRIRNRYNHEVNSYFLCDRGRFGYEFVNSDRRIRSPLLRSGTDASQHRSSPKDTLAYVCDMVRSSSGVIGIGSPRASLESNFALRSLVGPENFYSGLSGGEQELVELIVEILRTGPVPSAALHEVRTSDAVLVLGEDVPNSAPVIALALRQSARESLYSVSDRLKVPRWNDRAVRLAAQFEKAPFYLATPFPTRLDDVAVRTYRAAPDDVARLGFEIGAQLADSAPHVADLPEEVRLFCREIADALMHAARPLVVSGTSCGNRGVIEAAANVARALRESGKSPKLCFTVPECNTMGAGLMAAPSLDAAMHRVRDGTVDTVIVMENDLYQHAGEPALKSFFSAAKQIVVLDHMLNRTVIHADAVLPAGTFAESDGTFINYEGRGQRFFQVMDPVEEIRESWRWLRDVMVSTGKVDPGKWQTLDEVVSSIAEDFPILAGIREAAPDSRFRIEGMKIARQPHRYSGRTSMHADREIHEPETPVDLDAPFSFSMEGYQGRPPSALIPRFWAPQWNSVQSVNKFQAETGGRLVGGDPGRRLIEPATSDTTAYFSAVPSPFRTGESEWLLLPMYEVFGSEELSVSAPGIAERVSKPHLVMSFDDADSLGIREGDSIRVTLGGQDHFLPVRLRAGLPSRVAALPVVPDLAYVDLPAAAVVKHSEGGDKILVATSLMQGRRGRVLGKE
ncbi:MAG TPA: NADH-quinone oxidoreductase subunit NuoG [Desulfomonilaceae bacterium]|nr:NADH-quinone oxidoreductase subunit NuoG [Desulfomonilaceae bacterium]